MTDKQRHEETKTAIFKSMQIQAIYERTLNNCKYYEQEGMPAHLLNEVGTLRGVVYCLECFGVCVHDADLFHFIGTQCEGLRQESEEQEKRIRARQAGAR